MSCDGDKSLEELYAEQEADWRKFVIGLKIFCGLLVLRLIVGLVVYFWPT